MANLKCELHAKMHLNSDLFPIKAAVSSGNGASNWLYSLRKQQHELHFLVFLRSFPLSKWALELNELTPEMRAKLPPTDDRLRPDMRLFEHGLFHEVRAMKISVMRQAYRSSTQYSRVAFITMLACPGLHQLWACAPAQIE